ncbi:MAG TPA: hypothetical protein VMT67_06100 [Terriglobales bacterium]|nr:hypothetical protein [Terriglobales bacterium]
MGISLESMAIAMPSVLGHPNRVAFRGVLTTVDSPSDKAPAGARGHRVMLTRAAAEAAIPSLLGMGLDYSPRLDGHDARRKIGVITKAEVIGREIEIAGFLYGRDFPEMVEEIGKAPGRDQPGAGSRGRAGNGFGSSSRIRTTGSDRATHDQAGLGMSYEIADAVVEDIKAEVWVLNRVTFTGAAVLRRDKAAYKATWIELEPGV